MLQLSHTFNMLHYFCSSKPKFVDADHEGTSEVCPDCPIYIPGRFDTHLRTTATTTAHTNKRGQLLSFKVHVHAVCEIGLIGY